MDLSLTIQNEERNLIRGCKLKEAWAMKKVYEENYSYMMSVVIRYMKNEEDARDIVHDGFIKVFQKISGYKPGTSLRAWIRRIMLHTAIDELRRRQRKTTENIDDVHLGLETRDDILAQISAAELIAVIQKLTPRYRAVFNLYIIEGYSHKEIGEALEITESTSRSNLSKGRQMLKHLIKIHLRSENNG